MKLLFSLLLVCTLQSLTPVCALNPREENRQTSANKSPPRNRELPKLRCPAQPKLKSEEDNSIPLHAYVTRELEPAALELEAGHYKNALHLVRSQHFRNSASINESHYINALSLQALGRFDKCISEFNMLASRDCFTDKATIGRAKAARRTRAVSFDQIRFPSYCGIGPADFDF